MFEFYQNHKKAFWLFGMVGFTTSAFFLIWATAGTSLPFIATAAAKVGLDLGFLSGLSVPLASGVSALMVTGATFLAGVTLSLAGRLGSFICRSAKCCFCDRQEERSQDDLGNDDDLGNSSSAKLNQGLGVTTPGGTQVERRQSVTSTTSGKLFKEGEQPEAVNEDDVAKEVTSSDSQAFRKTQV